MNISSISKPISKSLQITSKGLGKNPFREKSKISLNFPFRLQEKKTAISREYRNQREGSIAHV
jgi:hypothetical protein